MNTFEIKKGYFTIWDGKTKYDYHVDSDHNYEKLDDPEFIYQYLVKENVSQEDIIDIMLKNLHKKRIIKIHHLNYKSLCVTLIGDRGSGKSAGATQIVSVDGLLAGRKVVSNMPIIFKVRYKDAEKIFQTEDLDAVTMLDFNDFETNYEDCWILIDETNIDIADALRSTSNQSLFFTNILQQMRHRKLDFCFTTQNENFMPWRARWQTDIYIKCFDIAMISSTYPRISEIGRKSRWQLYDNSGLVTPSLYKDIFKKLDNELKPYKIVTAWNTPFWNCYSTDLMQRSEKLKLKSTGEKRVLNTSAFEPVADKYNIPIDLLMNSINFDNERIEKKELWDKLGIIDDITMQRRIGKLYKQMNIITTDSHGSRYCIFPSKLETLRNITNTTLGMELEEFNG